MQKIQRDLSRLRNPARASLCLRFFKSGPGEYAAGDKFLGIAVPTLRLIAKKYRNLDLDKIVGVLKSPFHEERMIALFILIDQFKRGDEKLRGKIYKMYLANSVFINNWDLVDVTAPHIVGAYLVDKPKVILSQLAKSRNLWERRIAMTATQHFINRGECDDALRIAELLVDDPHDLIHKAVGWMLREVGKRCSLASEEEFLRRHAATMPRTMLRYAIEKFPEAKRRRYLGIKN